MKRGLAILALFVSFAAAPLFAQTQAEDAAPSVAPADSAVPPLPKPRLKIADKRFWILAGIQIGATVADFETTQWALRSDPSAREVNPLFGQRPGRAKMYAIGMPLTLFQIALQYHVKGTAAQTGKGRAAWIVGASINTGLHTALAVHNASLVHGPVCPAQGAGCL